MNITLREATPDDADILWKWANDPVVRKNSFDSSPIPWETHMSWFKEALGNERVVIFIALDEKLCPVGQIRFSAVEGDGWVITVSIAPEKRGEGIGRLAVQSGVMEITRRADNASFSAWIKAANLPSQRMFAHAGFLTDTGVVVHKGVPSVRMTYRQGSK